MTDKVVRLPPSTYVHVHDSNTNITQVVTGPFTYTVAPHQTLLTPEAMPFVVVPPGSYALITNPVIRSAAGDLVRDKHGQVKVNLGEREYRFTQAPFPLYPQEVVTKLDKLDVLTPHQSFVLRAVRAFRDESTDPAKPVQRAVGDEWLICGPRQYVPRVECDVVEKREAIIVREDESILLRAKNRFTDRTGVVREVGEEFLWTQPGAYLLGVDETMSKILRPTILTNTKALHVAVKTAFTDRRPWVTGKSADRRPGQVYLLTNEDTPTFTPLPAENIVAEVPLISLTKKQWAVILDPVENGEPKLGKRKVVTNSSFFLQPGERLEAGVLDIYVLSADEALLLTAVDEFVDTDGAEPIRRSAGEQWLLTGPREYIPSASVRIMKDRSGVEKRTKIILADGEGVYVRNTLTGEVRAVVAQTFMLSATEELWDKELPPVVEEKLAIQGASVSSWMERSSAKAKRDKTRVVRFMIPHNAVTQVYDFKKRTQRTIFGPDAVLLGPDEQFTVLSLSGSEWDPSRPQVCLPKQTDRIKALYLYLGPANLSDVLTVETADHARLSVQLSYDWYFDVEPGNVAQADECFKVPDFVGDCCSCIASRVRASIASYTFDHFHKNSSHIVRQAVFGIDKTTGEIKPKVRFPSNRLVVTAVDIQTIEVLDEKTKIALQESVKMAIEITTQAQEAVARQEASVREQQAKGKLERQMIQDKAANEVVRKGVIEGEAASASIETTGQAKAEAKARAEAAQIIGDTSVKVARTKVLTGTAMEKARMECEKKKQSEEISLQVQRDEVDISFEKQQAAIESGKFKRVMDSVGKGTIEALARAGPELQARLLKSLGLEGFLVTDGTHPINLFSMAKGMTAPPTSAPGPAA